MKHVKGFITRKTMLYETGVEYGDYTMCSAVRTDASILVMRSNRKNGSVT